MQILYLYIQDHHILSEQNLNFGGPFRFLYNPQEAFLQVSENPQFIANFFESTKSNTSDATITNFSAIIGQNGTGKTSVLNFIKDQLCGGIDSLRAPILLAVQREDGKIILYRSSDIKLLGDNLSDFGIYLSTLTLEPDEAYRSRGYEEEEGMPFLNSTSFISFSNVFDGRYEWGRSSLKDISTDYLLATERRSEQTMRIQSSDSTNDLETFRFNETERQIDFINFFDSKEVIPFKLPETLTVSSKRGFTMNNYVRNIKEKGALERNDLKAIADRIVQCLEETSFDSNRIKDWTVSFFYVQALLNFLQEVELHLKEGLKNNRISLLQKDYSELSLQEINDFLIDQLKEWSDRKGTLLPLYEMIVAIKELMSHIQVFATGEETMMLKEGRSFELAINHDQFNRLYSWYKRTYMHRPYLSFDWRSISSGEKAFLNIYSRFFSLSDKQTRISDNRLQKNIVILVDEGDLYLHPDWQRQFVFLLSRFLPKVYAAQSGGHRNIQVIFTSNSPIPVSDLPNSNVIFLQKSEGKTIVRDSLEDKKQTFGANIHTLLSDGFFLNNGLMGEFAKQKINATIEMLQGSREQVTKNREIIEKNISLVGEPLIRTKLVQMFTEKLQMNMMDIDNRVATLEAEIKLLKANRKP